LGVSLGKDLNEAVHTIDYLKEVEEARTLQFLEKNINESLGKDDGPSNLLMTNVSNLCEDLVEDEFDDLDLNDLIANPLPPVKEKKTRQRKIYDNVNVRRSNRKRTKKIY
jgi:hypothetical protein